MTQHAGNSKYGLDRGITMHVDGAVNAGAVVEINGENGDHVQCTPSGSAIDGVAADSTSGAGTVHVVTSGDVWARDSSTGGLSAGDTVGDGDSDSNGTLNASAGTEYDVWHGQQSDADGNNVSLIYLE